ncbi:hypothetical protein V8G54_006226 [Vigna mungo]|uniref:Uncharacterized protein n=1 Tax=Vigna mungo TaxID=3915 RepID=A0AAQ3S7U7_VIGMU
MLLNIFTTPGHREEQPSNSTPDPPRQCLVPRQNQTLLADTSMCPPSPRKRTPFPTPRTRHRCFPGTGVQLSESTRLRQRTGPLPTPRTRGRMAPCGPPSPPPPGRRAPPGRPGVGGSSPGGGSSEWRRSP